MISNYEQALIAQNPHWQGKVYDHFLRRKHDATAIADLTLEEIQIITGIRRCGKSTLMQVLINHLSSAAEKNILYINFDDPNYTPATKNSSELYNIVTMAEKLTGDTIQYLFLDEIQTVASWEKFVKSVYDSKRFTKIIVSGSNADLLNSQYATLLSGRYIETHIYPLSFREILQATDITDYLNLVENKATVLSLLDNLLLYGGFPRIHKVEKNDRYRILKSYYETILLKDCISNHNIRDSSLMTNLSYYLINHTSSLYSYNSLRKAIGSNENTIQQFIHILQNAYFLHEVKQFSYSLKDQNRAKKKIYCIDNGLINAVTFKFSQNYGKLLENLVYTEFCKQDIKDIVFYNDNKECDFIIYQQKDPLAVQVCYELTDLNKEREVNGLLAAMKHHSIKKGLIITYDYEQAYSDAVDIIPFWKYFFQPTERS